MTKTQIDKLLQNIRPANTSLTPQLAETHISWVILFGDHVYKIKKPIKLHFLDFSTLAKRKFYCERELILNRRLTENIYLDVLPINDIGDGPFFGPVDVPPIDMASDINRGSESFTPDSFAAAEKSALIDYAVHMRRMDDARRMDKLVQEGTISNFEIDRLAFRIAAFHSRADIIRKKDPQDIPLKFADLASEEDYLKSAAPSDDRIRISQAICISDKFSFTHRNRVEERMRNGMNRDCHGDLHTRNIFLLETPQPFDCIEFNDDIRQIDVLNEIAFLCMDLETLGRNDLSHRFLSTYRTLFPAFETVEDEALFLYYKSYRANIRAKINSLRSRSATSGDEQKAAIAESVKYLAHMNDYLHELQTIY